MGEFIEDLYNEPKLPVFAGSFTAALKKAQKKTPDKWINYLCYTSVWVIDNAQRNSAAEHFRPYFIQYLKKQDDDVIEELEVKVRRNIDAGK